MRGDRPVLPELRQYFFGKLFPQLNSPLIKGEDVPDDPLNKDLVLVHGNEASQGPGRQFSEKYGIGGPVPFEDLVRQQPFRFCIAFSLGLQLLPHLCFGFSVQEGLGLSEEVGQEDIVVGVPTAGRRHAELEPIIGMFVNTLAIRNLPSPQKTFDDFLQEVKKRTLGAFENQEHQFEDLVEQVPVNRDAGRNPLFDVMFVLQNVDLRLRMTPDHVASSSV